MQDHAHGHNIAHVAGSFWNSRAFLVCAVTLIIIDFLLWTEHLAHALGILPYLLVLVCSLMHPIHAQGSRLTRFSRLPRTRQAGSYPTAKRQAPPPWLAYH
jgi:hypothetical protein